MGTQQSVRYSALREHSDVAPSVRRVMQSNKARGTTPEVLLRKALYEAGLRGYRVNYRGLPGKPDIAFTRAKVVIFVHGCFWHGCPHCHAQKVPRRNTAYWQAKFAYNQERVDKQRVVLAAMGYHVLVLWECQVKQSLGNCVAIIYESLERRS